MSKPPFGLFGQKTKSGVQRISAEDAKQLLSDTPQAMLLDVRSPQEYADGHIKGSTLIPLPMLAIETKQLPEDLQAPIIVYCLSGARSRAAATQISRMGYGNVYDLGGIMRWPYEIVQGR